MILYMYIHVVPGQGLTTPRGRNFMSTGTSCHFGHLLQVLKKISLQSDFMHFFSWFYTCIYPRGRGRQPPGEKVLMSTEMSCHFIHLMQVLKKCLWSLILYNLFYDLIYVYSPGAGTDNPRGQNLDVNRKALSLYPFVASFKEISLKSDFIHFFSWFNTCI